MYARIKSRCALYTDCGFVHYTSVKLEKKQKQRMAMPFWSRMAGAGSEQGRCCDVGRSNQRCEAEGGTTPPLTLWVCRRREGKAISKREP